MKIGWGGRWERSLRVISGRRPLGTLTDHKHKTRLSLDGIISESNGSSTGVSSMLT